MLRSKTQFVHISIQFLLNYTQLLSYCSVLTHFQLNFCSFYTYFQLNFCPVITQYLLCLYSFSASGFHFVLRSISSQFLQQFNFLLNFNTRDFFHAKETVEKGPTELMVDPIRGNKPSSSRYLEDIFQHRNLMMMCAFRQPQIPWWAPNLLCVLRCSLCVLSFSAFFSQENNSILPTNAVKVVVIVVKLFGPR